MNPYRRWKGVLHNGHGTVFSGDCTKAVGIHRDLSRWRADANHVDDVTGAAVLAAQAKEVDSGRLDSLQELSCVGIRGCSFFHRECRNERYADNGLSRGIELFVG